MTSLPQRLHMKPMPYRAVSTLASEVVVRLVAQVVNTAQVTLRALPQAVVAVVAVLLPPTSHIPRLHILQLHMTRLRTGVKGLLNAFGEEERCASRSSLCC
jgi:hypothetical protein